MTRNSVFPHPGFLIGFESLLNEIVSQAKRPNFPPVDIEVVDAEAQSFRITAAVAGYKMENISITQKEDRLIIEGTHQRDETKIYQNEGIAKRNFKLEFLLHQYAVIQGSARLEHGLLEIDVTIEIPEDKKPRSIPINA
ncbi:MAG: Hsp20 family protein [Hafnia sp.]